MAPQLTAMNGFSSPVAGALNDAGYQFLANPALAFNEHRDIAFGGLGAERDDAAHGGRGGNHVLVAKSAGLARMLGANGGFEGIQFHRVAQRNDQSFGRYRLDEVVGRALAHGRNHGFK